MKYYRLIFRKKDNVIMFSEIQEHEADEVRGRLRKTKDDDKGEVRGRVRRRRGQAYFLSLISRMQ